MEFRNYRSGDEQHIVDVWNECFPTDVLSQEQFLLRVVLEENFAPEGLILCLENEKIIGFALALIQQYPLIPGKLDTNRAWLYAIAVLPEFRRQGIGTKLLKQAEEYASAQARKQMVLGGYPTTYIWPGVDVIHHKDSYEFFTSNGYKHVGDSVSMGGSLLNFAPSAEIKELKAKREAEGYRFTSLTPQLTFDLLQFVQNNFSASWTNMLRRHLESPANRGQILLVTTPSGEIGGYCQYGELNGSLERFGPFGVHPNLRGLGLGKILFADCLQAMRSKGAHNLWFLWAGEHNPAGHLYRSFGLSITRRYWNLTKELV